MSVLQAIVLGIVQGLTEFLPVSSSGHLILVPWLFNWTFFLENPALNKTFDVALHVGTFAGTAFYFRRDVARYTAAFVRSVRTRSAAEPDERMAWLLILASVPGAAAGALGERVVERHLGAPWLIAAWLIVFGVVLVVVDRRAPARRSIESVGVRDALAMGAAQALSLSPGISRSGATIAAGRALGLTREASVRFSFLMSLAIIGGAGLYKGVKVAGDGLPPGTVTPFLAGMAVSALSGFVAVAFMLRVIRRRGFESFLVYRVLAALLVFGVIAAGIRPATI